MGVSNETLTTELLRHVEHIVDLNNTKVRVETLQSREIRKDVAAPADITLAWTEFEFSGCGSITLIIDRNVIDAVVRPAAEFPDVVRDLDCKTVV